MKKVLLLIFLTAYQIQSQTDMTTVLPYYEIPDYPETFTAGTVAARQVDGLGFRFFWATEGLTETNLAYKPNEDVRSTKETIEHIYNLSNVIVNSTLKQPNSKNDISQMTFDDIRRQTLINLKTAADVLRTSDYISEYKIIFGEREIPFWNNINGPIADAIWHCGQIASFRRTSGNPINPKVDHFMGTVKE
jgi:hypothetical protein